MSAAITLSAFWTVLSVPPIAVPFQPLDSFIYSRQHDGYGDEGFDDPHPYAAQQRDTCCEDGGDDT